MRVLSVLLCTVCICPITIDAFGIECLLYDIITTQIPNLTGASEVGRFGLICTFLALGFLVVGVYISICCAIISGFWTSLVGDDTCR